MEFLLNIGLSIIALYLFFSSAYPFILSLFGLIRTIRSAEDYQPEGKTAILIPCYKEDQVIVNTVRQIKSQNPEKYGAEVIVISDQLKDITNTALWRLGAWVIPVKFEKSTKVKSLKVAMNQLDWKGYDHVIILDADNEIHSQFIPRILSWISKGYLAVQGCRTPKNSDTGLSVLDGLSEVANNHIYGKGPFNIGFSSRMSGSGMAFKWNFFYDLIKDMDAIGGFDKELELEITNAGKKIAYAEDAIVYDEKVRSGENFSRQRSRWIAAQYQYLNKYAIRGLSQGLFAGNFDFTHKVLNLALPPRIILPFATLIFFTISLILPVADVLTWIFLAAFMLNVLTYLISWSNEDVKLNIGQLVSVFVAVKFTLLALTKLKKARKTFIHTVHGQGELK